MKIPQQFLHVRQWFTVPRLLAALAVLAVAAAAAFALLGRDGDDERYRTETVSAGAIEQTVSANGTLNPVTLVSVGTQVSGLVEKIFVDYNDRVQKGQVLMVLDDSVLQASLRQSEANLEAARSALALAQTDLQRLEPLVADGFVSAQEYDQARQAVRDAQAKVIQTSAQVDRDRTSLGYSVIRSPVSGVVVARVVDVGQTVAASFNTPELFRIAADLKKMQIDAYFAEADVGQIRVGQKTGFRVDAFPEQRFPGVVKQVRLDPKTESNVVTYDVVVSVDNDDGRLLPGMTAYVDVTIAERHDVLRVPNTALRFRPEDTEPETADTSTSSPGLMQGVARGVAGGGPGMGGPPRGMGSPRNGTRPRDGERRGSAPAGKGTVYVLIDGVPKETPIETGIADRRWTEVRSGLKAGDVVVVEDLSLVQEKRSGKGFSLGM